MRGVLLTAFALLFSALFFSCAKEKAVVVSAESEKPAETIHIGVFQDFEPFGIALGPECAIESFSSERLLFERLLSGELDMAFVPSAAVERFGKSVVSLGVWRRERMFLALAQGVSVESLRGKRVPCFNFSLNEYVSALPAAPELSGAELDFSRANASIVNELLLARIEAAVLPEKYANILSRKSGSISLRELDADVPRVVLAANGRFYQTHFDYIQRVVSKES